MSHHVAHISPKDQEKHKRPPKPKPQNPIDTAINEWLNSLPSEVLESINSTIEALISSAPKRWTAYPPMVLLPSGSFTSSAWTNILSITSPSQQSSLWTLILKEISKREGKGILTHLAVNAGIPLSATTTSTQDETQENILRTPSGLIMLHGDYGPDLLPDHEPTTEEFNSAFWVATKQNGIIQIWAPRYTMFSRGNIKEKARLLEFHNVSRSEEAKTSKEEIAGSVAVDLYAGIGYFVFSYVAMGMKRVVGWELNPWSVEGLRRGAIANGWNVKVVKRGQALVEGEERIIVFQEDNGLVGERMTDKNVRRMIGEKVLHVNCGLLPTSVPIWETALGLLGRRGWLHLHENVGVNDIQQRKEEFASRFCEWEEDAKDSRIVEVEHVEQVKTFAPGVWHCVFDVFIHAFE
jgi:tRNA wybutosine-synthesizing protein 2